MEVYCISYILKLNDLFVCAELIEELARATDLKFGREFYSAGKTPEGCLKRTRSVRKSRSASQRSGLYILK